MNVVWEINENLKTNMMVDVQICEVTKDILPCYFPFCENDLACKKNTVVPKLVNEPKYQGKIKRNGKLYTTRLCDDEDEAVNETKALKNEVDNMSSIKQYFDYQKEINMINSKKDKLEKAQKELYNNIKTDIETVFLALDCEELGTKIELTKTGIEIYYSVRIKNDYGILYPLNTDLFTQLNNVIGVKGKLDIESKRYNGGNQVYHLILRYELE